MQKLTNVLVDLHHQSLFDSLLLLFEKRLGYNVFRPIGMEWYPNYWDVFPSIDTAKQYLQPHFVPKDGTRPLNERLKNTITLEEFKNMGFDILVASIPQHIPIFKRLISEFQPQAKLIYQIGNHWNVDPNEVKNVMASAKVNIPPSVNGVIYHQEFPLDIFYNSEIKADKKIYSFINCLATADLFKKDWELFLELERLMPDWEFKSFGGQCRDGSINNTNELADKMREASFIFHCKTGGDGYGHVIHNAAAVGRPLITRFSDYKDKLAESLITYPCTSIHVDNFLPEDIVSNILYVYNETGMYESYLKEIHNRFMSTVNFNKEEQVIRKFLLSLQ